MRLEDERKIAASREEVYAALNDPEVLRKSIPGCEELEMESETSLRATVSVKVGPVKARFRGAVTLSDLNPPESYTISGEGKGGTAGFASGSAKVRLTEDDGVTTLRYTVDAKVGGKVAQLGSRVIDSVARNLAGKFFTKFAKQVGRGPVPDLQPEEAAVRPEIPPAWFWVAAAAVLAGTYFYLGG